MKLIADGATAESIRTESDADQRIGDPAVQQKLELRLVKNANEANSPTFAISTGDWGPLWLIHKYQGERSKTDPKVWQGGEPGGGPGANGLVGLEPKIGAGTPRLAK